MVVTKMILGRLGDGCLTTTGVNLFVINRVTNYYYKKVFKHTYSEMREDLFLVPYNCLIWKCRNAE